MAAPNPIPGPIPDEPVRLVRRAEEPSAGPVAGQPAMVALPSFIVGAVASAMVLIGVVPAGTVGASLAIEIAAAVGLLVATVWAARIGENAQAGFFGVIAGYFTSHAILGLGLMHGWFGIGPATLADTQKIFVISWMVIVTMLFLGALRLPVVFLALFAMIDAALLLDLLGIIQNSTNLTKAAGWVTMAFSALLVYLWVGTAYHATGGREFPLGRPLLHA